MEFSTNLQAITQTGLAPKVVDTVLKGNVLALRLLGNAQKWRGRKIEKAIQFQKPTTGGSFSGLDPLATNKSDTKRRLSFDLRGYYQSVVIEGMEDDVTASDPQAAVGLVVEAMEEAGNAMADSVAELIYGDGTGNSNKDFLGLKAIVDDGSVVATYGGLGRSTYTTIKGTRTAITGGLTNLSVLATADSAARHGTDRVTLHVTGEAKWNELEALIQPTINTNVQGDGYKQVTRTGIVQNQAALKGEVGFDALYYRGAPVVADQKCPDLYWYGLNEKHLAWYGLKSNNPKYKPVDLGGNQNIEGSYDQVPSKNMGVNFSGLMNSQNQYGQIGFFILLGNLISFNPNRHFQLVFSA